MCYKNCQPQEYLLRIRLLQHNRSLSPDIPAVSPEVIDFPADLILKDTEPGCNPASKIVFRTSTDTGINHSPFSIRMPTELLAISHRSTSLKMATGARGKTGKNGNSAISPIMRMCGPIFGVRGFQLQRVGETSCKTFRS